MTRYHIIFESLQDRVDIGELSVEDASILNDMAYEKYGDDDTEYEAVTEAYYDGHIQQAEREIERIKSTMGKDIENYEKQIDELERRKKRLETNLVLKLRPFEKKIEKYEKLNLEDPDGTRAKKRKIAAATGLAVAAGTTAAISIHKQKSKSKTQKNSDTKKDD